MYASAGSVTLDLAIDKHLTLLLKPQCYKISTGVYGPLPSGTGGIILGRISLNSQGLIEHPRITDGDFKREFETMG